ncbi:MAG: GntR family transcriptional regulator [Ruminococcus sp.]
MNITISYTSEKPMYEQIEEGIRKAIYEGEFKNGDMLPSVRQLAKDLNVSAITTKRAYIDLEHEGFVYTVSGKGTFVRLDRLSELQDSRLLETLEKLRSCAEECRKAGADKEKIIEIINEIYNDNRKELWK